MNDDNLTMNHRRVAALGLAACMMATGCVADLEQEEQHAEDVGVAASPLSTVHQSQWSVMSSGMCLGGNTAIAQVECQNSLFMTWQFLPTGSKANQYFIVDSTGKCLDVPWSSQVPGQDVQLHLCKGTTNQRWNFIWSGSGFEIRPEHASHLCLDVEYGDSVPNRALQIYPCHNGDNQRFRTFVYEQVTKHESCDPTRFFEIQGGSFPRLYDGEDIIIDFRSYESKELYWRCRMASQSGSGFGVKKTSCPSNSIRAHVKRTPGDNDVAITCYGF